MSPKKKKIIVAGGTGFIGSHLAARLQESGVEVVILTRSPSGKTINPSCREVCWDGKNPGAWEAEIDGAYAVVNLAGASIAGENLLSILFQRWSPARKDLILRSRVEAGLALTRAIKSSVNKPRVFIQASGIGFYGTIAQANLTEDDPAGSDFLASVSTQWEDSSRGVAAEGVRHCVIRSGVVLHPSGGILPLIALPIRLFVGGRLGNGRQPFPWIHLEDEIAAIQFLIDTPPAPGLLTWSRRGL